MPEQANNSNESNQVIDSNKKQQSDGCQPTPAKQKKMSNDVSESNNSRVIQKPEANFLNNLKETSKPIVKSNKLVNIQIHKNLQMKSMSPVSNIPASSMMSGSMDISGINSSFDNVSDILGSDISEPGGINGLVKHIYGMIYFLISNCCYIM